MSDNPCLPVTAYTIEEEKKDAVYYRNTFMFELCQLAEIGLLIKTLGTSNPEELAKAIDVLVNSQKKYEEFS